MLDVDEPRQPLARWGHARYCRRTVPLVGALLADRTAYAYLPASTAYLPSESALLGLLHAAGFRGARKRRLAAGAAQLLLAER